MRRIVALAAAALVLLCGLAFAASELMRRTETGRAVIERPVDRVLIRAEGGDVTVRAGVSPGVIVDHEVRWLVRQPEVRTSISRGTLLIETRCDPLTSALRCRVELDVAVPPAMDVEVQGEAADVRLRGLQGRVVVDMEDGDLEGERIEPVTLEASTGSGNVDLDVIGRPTRLVARAVSGDVSIEVPYGAWRVEADSERGDVEVRDVLRDDLAPQRIEAHAEAGDVTVRAR